jgi:hypothetical protein
MIDPSAGERGGVVWKARAGLAVSTCLLDMALAASCRPLAARFAAQPTGCPGDTLRSWSPIVMGLSN